MHRGQFKATSFSKVFANYFPMQTSANSHVYEQDLLRDRVWDAYYNIPLARGVITRFATSVVGTGIKHHSNINQEVLGITQEEKIKKDREIDFLINSIINSKDCDYYRVSNFYQLQRQAIITKLVDGGCLGLLSVRQRENENVLTIRNLESIQLCNENNQTNSSTLINGIEFDKNGVKAYHILKNHPYDVLQQNQEWVKIPAFSGIRQNVIYYYDKERAGQRTGISILSSILENLMQMDKMTEAKLTRAVLSAMLAVVFFNNKGIEEDDIQYDEDGNEITIENSHRTNDNRGFKWEAGMSYQADPEEGEPKLIDPKPDETYKEFVDVLLNEVGSAIGMPRSILTGEFRSNYTASRGELLEFWKEIRMIRSNLVADYCQPYKEQILLQAVMDKKIHLKGFLTDKKMRTAWCNSRWEGQPMGMIDPLKEIKSYNLAVDSKFMTKTTATRNIDGSSYDENIAVLARERDLEKKKLKDDENV
jgi:lambda family phage portal protein